MFLIIYIVYILLLENFPKNNTSKEKEKIFCHLYLLSGDQELVFSHRMVPSSKLIVNFRLLCLQKFPSWGRRTFWPKMSRNGGVDIFVVKGQLLYLVKYMYGNDIMLHFQEEVKKLEEEWTSVNEQLNAITEEGRILQGEQQAICQELRQKKTTHRDKQVAFIFMESSVC